IRRRARLPRPPGAHLRRLWRQRARRAGAALPQRHADERRARVGPRRAGDGRPAVAVALPQRPKGRQHPAAPAHAQHQDQRPRRRHGLHLPPRAAHHRRHLCLGQGPRPHPQAHRPQRHHHHAGRHAAADARRPRRRRRSHRRQDGRRRPHRHDPLCHHRGPRSRLGKGRRHEHTRRPPRVGRRLREERPHPRRHKVLPRRH
ncbi:hypothetical protein BN1708_018755, partial [Verticillium longisporum]